MKDGNSCIPEEDLNIDFAKYGDIPEAVLDDLNRTYDRIDMMNRNEVIAKLRCFHINTEDSETCLRESLKNTYKEILLIGKNISLCEELLPYYVVIDFEATCNKTNSPDYKHEIIEFPAVLVSSKEQKIIDTFQMYCKPQINPKVSEFCTELTGINQEQVDSAETFDKVLIHFQKWLSKHKLGVKYKYCIVTDGPWDMTKFLYSQCHYLNIPFPKWANKWVNLKKTFNKFYKSDKFCLTEMLDYLNMEFVGRHHCGLDDARNIARILLRMIYDGANIQKNERISGAKRHKDRQKDSGSQIIESQEKKENNNKAKSFRVEAHYKPCYYAGLVTVYKRMRRERLIAEVKIARTILKQDHSKQKTQSSVSEKINENYDLNEKFEEKHETR